MALSSVSDLAGGPEGPEAAGEVRMNQAHD